MRNRGLIECLQLCELFFLRLLQCQDRLLRVIIQTHIINDIKKQNEKHKNHKLNSVCSLIMFLFIKYLVFRFYRHYKTLCVRLLKKVMQLLSKWHL